MSDGVELEVLVQGFLQEKLPGIDDDLLNYVVGKNFELTICLFFI